MQSWTGLDRAASSPSPGEASWVLVENHPRCKDRLFGCGMHKFGASIGWLKASGKILTRSDVESFSCEAVGRIFFEILEGCY